MRKDVRFGLTIGAILLAVLVVYVLVVPGDAGPEQVTLEMIDPSAATDSATATEPGDSEPSVLDTPIAATDTPPAPQDMAIIPPSDNNAGDTIASTRTPAEAMAPSGQWDWDKILNTGSMMAATTDRPASAANVAPVQRQTMAPPAPAPARLDPQPALNGAAASADATTYTVQPGDSFSNIAQKLYGDARHYIAIEKANPGVDSRRLKVGQTINVPARESVVSGDSAIQAASIQQTEAPAAVDASRQYQVQPNDSLYKIAQKLYGDGSRWQELHETNRQAIGENPANLKVGQVLTLPEAPTQSAAR